MPTILVTCGDEPTEEQRTHAGRVQKIATFEEHDGRWYQKVPYVDITSGRDQLGHTTLGAETNWRQDRSLASVGDDPKQLGPRYDGYGDDILGKRVVLPCQLCPRNEVIRGARLVPILDTLARAGESSVSLRGLAAILRKC